MRNKCKMVIICLTVAVCSLNLGYEDANGYGSYFEEKTYENRGKLKLK